LGRNAGEGDDRKIDEDFNLAQDEINDKYRFTSFSCSRQKVVVVLNIGGVIETASWKIK
jgi:beta-glucosidase